MARSGSAASGPTWVGIGAQRSGTTWFTGLATQHPAVGLARGGRKELHYFNRFLVEEWGDDDAAAYRHLFAPGAGEFTPAYLRLPWVAELLVQACRVTPLVVVLLRDPIDRLESAIRWRRRHEPINADSSREDRAMLPIAWWESAMLGSAYGTQLAHWRDVVGSENMLVMQYEQVVRDPVHALTTFWGRLGLEPVDLREIGQPSPTSTSSTWSMPSTWARRVVQHLEGEIAMVLDEWDLDPDLWSTWNRLAGQHGASTRTV